MEVLPEITPINCYNVERGKLAASVKWLIGRVYGGSAPDLLSRPIRYNDNNTFHLETTVITALTNGSLYSNAAAKIFKDQSLMNQPQGVVLRMLANNSVPLMISGEEVNIDERTLVSIQPFNQAAHLAVMDALMTAHMRSIITIDRVVGAVQKYTTVDPREEPMDSVDALLFWINKICLLVRDDLEKSQLLKRDETQFGQVVVPEMEDLYEDMCDGACVCALVAFYRDEMNMQQICFNDPMSLADCQYNLMLLKSFCERLPFNPFYFEVEDILYLHESLQPNVNAFLADLFQYFEGSESQYAASPVDPAPSRRFVPVQGIPDLRAQNSAKRPIYPPAVKYPQPGMSRAVSLMSADSLMTARSNDAIHAPRGRVAVNGGETTNFGELTHIPFDGQHGVTADGSSSGSGYTRSDSMPAASIRLALEEKRREHEKKRFLESNLSESERVQKQKDAFFTLMQRLEKNSDSRSGRTLSEVGATAGIPGPKEIRSLQETVQDLKKQLHEMTLQQEHLSRQVGGRQMSHATSQPAIHTDFAYVQEPLQNLGNPYATLPHNVAKSNISQSQHTYAMPYTGEQSLPGQPIYQAPSQPQAFMPHQQLSIDGYGYQLGGGAPQMMGTQMGATTPIVSSAYMPVSTAVGPTPFMLHQQQAIPVTQPLMSSPPVMLPSSAVQSGTMADMGASAGHFRLHENDASSSRLDPPLELNHNLTNWGLTYKAGHMSRRRTWENGTFIKSEMDLVNQPEVVPHAPTEQDQARPMGGVSRVHHFTPPRQGNHSELVDDENSHSKQTSATPQFPNQQKESDGLPPPPHHQQSPPKDPTSPPVNNSLVKQRQSASGGSQFIVQDVTNDRPVIGLTREMEAKREALLAKTLRRREQIEQKVEEIEAKNAERRLAELEKQEAAEQRKRERELHKQKILEDYKRKKMEKELEANGGLQNGRGHSQPPTPSRPKSTVELARSKTLQRQGRPQSTFDDGCASSSSASNSARIMVPSTAEPTLKLYSKYVPKSNRSMIINALQYSVFPGAVSDKQRNEVLGELAKSDSKHFLLLFRDHKCRYMGAYSWDQQSDSAYRIHGKGPNICHESMMMLMFKYDSGSKTFSQIPTKHLSATIDGFTLQDQYMQTPKIPHSNSINR